MAAAPQPLRCLITGGAGGLGLEVARQLLERGHQVMLACRDASRGGAAAAQLQAAATSTQQQLSAAVTVVPCDLASFASVRRCAELVRERWQGRLDVLVCNAAVIPAATAATTAADGLNEQVQVNHLSHMLLAHLLLPCLAASAAEHQQQQQQCGTAADGSSSSSSSRCRVVVVGSRQHLQVPPGFQDPASVAELLSPQHAASAAVAAQLTPMQLYAVTKLWNLWFTRHLADHVLPGGVIATCVSPGFVPSTGLGRHVAGSALGRWAMRHLLPWAPFAVSLKEGAGRIVSACVGEEEGRASGLFLSGRAAAEPLAAALDAAKAAEAWRLSAEAVGVAGGPPLAGETNGSPQASSRRGPRVAAAAHR